MNEPTSGQTRRRQQSRERLIDAAARLFKKRGYDDVSIDEIAAEAGLVKGTFYYNFSGKEELVLAVAAAAGATVESKLATAITEGRSTRDVLSLVLEHVGDWVHKNPKVAQAAFPISLRQGLEGKRRDHAPSFRGLLSEILTRGQQRGEIRRDVPPQGLAVHLAMSFVTEALLWLAERKGPTMRQRAELSLELFLSGADASQEKR